MRNLNVAILAAVVATALMSTAAARESLSSLRTDVNQNTADISTNAGDIATHSGDIQTNTDDIAETRAAICDIVDVEGLSPVPDFCSPPPCPCWSDFTADEIVAALNAADVTTPFCQLEPGVLARAGDTSDGDPAIGASIAFLGFEPVCGFVLNGVSDVTINPLPEQDAIACIDGLAAIIPRIDWCP